MKKLKVLMIFFVKVGPRLSFPKKYISFLSKYIIDKLIDFHFECRKSLSKYSGIRVFFLEPNYLIESIPILQDPQKVVNKNLLFYFRFEQKQKNLNLNLNLNG